MTENQGNFKIVQMIQATGWRAVYKKEGRVEQIPLACFALVNEDKLDYVIGMVPLSDDRRVISPSLCKDFLGYVGPGESLDLLKEKERSL